MNCFGLFPSREVDKVERSEAGLVVFLHLRRWHSRCPNCTLRSWRVHSSYTRSVGDTAVGEQALLLKVKVRRFYCSNEGCQQQTFTERLDLLAPYARRTERLKRVQAQVGTFLGGEAGSRLLARLKMPVSAASILHDIRNRATENYPTPRVLGVDDWGIKKGCSYGTILVDLEKHKVVDLLSDRSAAALELWLRSSPGVEIIVRDRSYDYMMGANAGAPGARHVADRWHLLHNLQEMLERWLATMYATLRRLPVTPELQGEVEKLMSRRHRTSRPTRAAKEAGKVNRAKRLARYNEVKVLYTAGMPLLTISKKLGMDRKTVRAYAYAESFPEKPPYPYVPNVLTPYLDYLEKRHTEGCENALQLYREIYELGYRSTSWNVLRWMQPRRRTPSKHGPKPRKASNDQSLAKWATKLTLPSAPQLSWLMVRDADTLKNEEALVLRHLSQHQAFAFMREHAKAFQKMVCQRKGELDAWLDTAAGSGVVQLKTFAEGLRRDYAEVRAALELPWSNGQTEGQVNKLKLIKRQMYGRASFDLLRQRVLLAA